MSSPPSSLTSSPFVQHVFTHVDLELVQKPKSNPKNPGFDATNTILHSNSSSPKPRLWAQRLSGHRLHLRWDVSPKNPHRAEYCIVVNTRRDYSSLCSASGERFGVLPPDLMHVTYYGSGHRHRHGHGEGQGHSQGQGQPGQGHDLVIGCTGKRTNYILDALEEGVLYYFNVFVRDTSTNVSLPYVATTLKYYTPKVSVLAYPMIRYLSSIHALDATKLPPGQQSVTTCPLRDEWESDQSLNWGPGQIQFKQTLLRGHLVYHAVWGWGP